MFISRPLTGRALSAALVLLVFTCASEAQSNDMWAGQATKLKLFIPHLNTCTASEVFVAVGGGSKGFCMEATERTAAVWTEAKEACLANNARLPEVAEFQFACSHPPAGLTGMTGNYEWTGNFASTYLGNVDAFAWGNGGCNDGTVGEVGSTGGSTSITFRCVR